MAIARGTLAIAALEGGGVWPSWSSGSTVVCMMDYPRCRRDRPGYVTSLRLYGTECVSVYLCMYLLVCLVNR